MAEFELMGGSPFFDKVFEENLKERKIILNEDITEDAVEKVILQILKYNTEDKGLPVEKRKEIKLYINSVGGEVANGYGIIDAIKVSKTPIHGIVLSYAYSMGGLIILACHKRSAFENATILLHDGNCGASSSGSKFKDIAKFYEEMDERIKKFVLGHSKMSSDFYESKRDREFYMYAEQAKELGIIDFVIGQDIDLDEVI